MTKISQADRFARIIEDLTVLHDAAADPTDRAAWEAAIAATHAARKAGEAAFAKKKAAAAKAATPSAEPTISFGGMASMMINRAHGRNRGGRTR